MKTKRILPILLVSILTSCKQNAGELHNYSPFLFSTFVDTHLYSGQTQNLNDVVSIFEKYDALTDNYRLRDVNNVYTINQSNDDVIVAPELYELLKTAVTIKDSGVNYFNPFMGSLNKKWKSAIENKEVLSNAVIDEELTKISGTTIEFKENNTVKRIGEGEIDLGAFAKGYAIGKVKDYLKEKNISSYLVNAGSSSVLLGEKLSGEGMFSVDLKEYPSIHLHIKNSVISTSSIFSQGAKIDDKTYSHIINPNTGSALALHETVVVVNEVGYLGDALSTSLMNTPISEIQELENTLNFKCIVFDDGVPVHSHNDLKIYLG